MWSRAEDMPAKVLLKQSIWTLLWTLNSETHCSVTLFPQWKLVLMQADVFTCMAWRVCWAMSSQKYNLWQMLKGCFTSSADFMTVWLWARIIQLYIFAVHGWRMILMNYRAFPKQFEYSEIQQEVSKRNNKFVGRNHSELQAKSPFFWIWL